MGLKSVITFRNIAIFLVVVLLIFVVFYFTRTKDCKSDEDCFNEAFSKCTKAKALLTNEESSFLYEIKGSRKNSCIITVQVASLSQDTDLSIRKLFEGKSMVCSIPKSQLAETEIGQLESLIDHCTGPLKESIYELIIEKLYGVIAQNLGNIVIEMETNFFNSTRT